MKRSDRIYKFIGQAVVYIGIWTGGVAMLMWGFMQNTIY